MPILEPSDLTPFADIDDVKASEMIADALATATVIVPRIQDFDFPHVAAAKAILRGAVLRWNEAGTGAFQTQTAGPFQVGMDTRQVRRGMFWPSEIEQLAALRQPGTKVRMGWLL